jgi:hypothetical protein
VFLCETSVLVCIFGGVLSQQPPSETCQVSLRTLRSSLAWRRTLSDGAQSGEEKDGWALVAGIDDV